MMTHVKMKNLHAYIRPKRKLVSQRPISVLAVLFLLTFYALLAKPGTCAIDKREKREGHPLKSFSFSFLRSLYYRCHPQNLLHISSFLSLLFPDHVT